MLRRSLKRCARSLRRIGPASSSVSAYSWFNRLTALRYLDARGLASVFCCRVLMAAIGPEETQPEVLKLMRSGALPAELAQHTNLRAAQ